MTIGRRLFVCWLMALTASVCLHDRGAMRAVQLQPSGGPTESIATVRRLIEAGRYDEAEKAGLSLVATLDAGRSGVTLEIAEALDLVLDARRLGRRMTNPGSVELAERAFKIKEAALPPDEPTLATTLVLLGHARAAHRNVDTGRVAVDRAMALRERALGPDHLDIAATWNARAWVERYGGNYPDAAAAAERALAIARRLEQPAGREAAAALEMLAFAARSMGEADRAVSLAEEMLAIEERMRGPDHPALVNALLALASAVLDAGDLDQARLVHERAFRLLEATPGSEYRTAFELLLYASKVNGLGEHAQALSAAERAVAIAEKATGPASTLSAAALERLATTYADLGDHGAAARIRQRTVALWEATQGPDGLHVGAALTALAQSFEQGGQIDAAFDIIERAIAILSIGKQPIMYHEALSTKGRLLMGRGRLEQARAVLEQARQVSANGNMGAVRYNHAATLTLLARLERQAGHPARAVPLYRDAIRRVEQQYGVAHPTIADWRTDLAVTLAATGAFDEARRLLVDSETASLAHLRLVSRTLTERAALAFASSRVSGADLAVTLAADPAVRIRRDIDVAWDLIIQGRTIVLDEMAARQRAVVADRALRDQWAVLNRARTRLANLIVRGPDGQPADRYQALVERSRAQRDRAERELAEASVAFREEQSRARAGLREVVARLPPRAALVAYVRYTATCLAAVDRDSRESPPPAARAAACQGPTGLAEPAYAAFVARPGRPVRVVRLGRAETIERAITQWRAAIQTELSSGGLTTSRAEMAYRLAGRALRARVWDPVQPLLTGASTTFVVPDGALHLVDLATLPVARAGYLVDAPWTLHYLLAERDLVRAPFEASTTSLLALGAPDFDKADAAAVRTVSAMAGAPQHAPADRIASPPGRPARSGCDALSAGTFDPLPGTQQEIASIAALWQKRRTARSSGASVEDHAHEIILLEAGRATEKALKELARGRRVLHLATHGFFVDRFCHASSANGSAPAGPLIEESPLLRAGLVLAGANQRSRHVTEEEDGILTAEEVAGLDLTDAQWAVLSACDTGRGDWQAREGIVGLRRAFEVAGARTVILSLWSVLDTVTSDWMAELYRAKFVRSLSTAGAVRAANRSLLAERRARGLSTHPLYWSGFIATGDWR